MINFNDGMPGPAGSSRMLSNLVWNSCRESQDHGPFNRSARESEREIKMIKIQRKRKIRKQVEMSKENQGVKGKIRK